MKRAPGRRPTPLPLDIVEVPAARPDPRSAEPDEPSRAPAVTQKISRAELEEALRRTKSGTRRAVRSEHELPPNDDDPRRERDSLPGPRDDEDEPHVGPQVIPARPIVVSASPPADIPVVPTPSAGTPLVDRKGRSWAIQHVQITPRLAFVAGLAVALFVLVAACLGFFAGRIAPGSR